GAMLTEMQAMLERQQAEIDRLRAELDATHASAAPASPATPAPASAVASTTARAGTAAQADDLTRKVDDLVSRWGKFKLSGDVRVRYEGFFNQGFDALTDIAARNRERLRVRAQLSSAINDHFDWA